MSSALPDGLWLNVGCGNSAPAGWVSIDGSWQGWFATRPLLARAARALTGREVGHWPREIICRDVRRGLGCGEATTAVVYSSHVIEHLERSQAVALLGDARRALRPNGICRVVTPDLAALVCAYQRSRAGGEPRAADQFIEQTLLSATRERPLQVHAFNALAWYRTHTAFHVHRWLYDSDSLIALFEEAGFDAPRALDYLDSAIPIERLGEVEHASRVQGGAGIVVEARR
jgi:SAM-dependent methyltransferase